MDQVRRRLRPGEVQPTVQEGPPGELAGEGLPRPGGKKGLQPQGQSRRGAVALQLGGVLPGVAAGGPGDGAQAAVDGPALPVVKGAVHQGAVGPPGHGAAVEGGEHLVGGVHGPRPGQAEYADGGGEHGGGDGGDGVGHGGHLGGDLSGVPRLGRGYAAFFVQCSTKRGGFQWKKPRPHGGDGALQGQLRRASGT